MPQKSWSDKDERQYRHIMESELEQGRSKERAKEIAARTVNRQRRKENRTRNKSTMGSGNPNQRLEDRTVEELRNRAADLSIGGRSKMKKDQLVRAIRGVS